MSRSSAGLGMLLLLFLMACGGGERDARTDTAATTPPDTAMGAPPAAGDTGQAGQAPAAPAPGGQQAPAGQKPPAQKGGKFTPQMVALGDSIFHGLVAGGPCTACHGQKGVGTPVGPNLTDQEWLNTDGTYEGIVKVVTSGVAQPKKHPAPMPPMGGASFTPEQVRAVAAYVYSLSHKT